MHKTKFIGLRMEKEFYDTIEEFAKEEKLDKTTAMKIMVREGLKALILKKVISQYQMGLVSVDKAAKISKLTINEMMKLIALSGVKSEETLEEYKKGIKILIKNA